MFSREPFCSHRSWMLLTCRARLGTCSGWEKEPSLAQGSCPPTEGHRLPSEAPS